MRPGPNAGINPDQRRRHQIQRVAASMRPGPNAGINTEPLAPDTKLKDMLQ